MRDPTPQVWHSLDCINKMTSNGKRFQLSTSDVHLAEAERTLIYLLNVVPYISLLGLDGLLMCKWTTSVKELT